MDMTIPTFGHPGYAMPSWHLWWSYIFSSHLPFGQLQAYPFWRHSMRIPSWILLMTRIDQNICWSLTTVYSYASIVIIKCRSSAFRWLLFRSAQYPKRIISPVSFYLIFWNPHAKHRIVLRLSTHHRGAQRVLPCPSYAKTRNNK